MIAAYRCQHIDYTKISSQAQVARTSVARYVEISVVLPKATVTAASIECLSQLSTFEIENLQNFHLETF